MRANRFLALAIVVPGLALAHSGATGIVKARMDGMATLGQAMKSLKTELSGTPDPDALFAAAHAVHTRSGSALIDLFPEGSVTGPSEASHDIWEEPERFAMLAHDLAAAAERMKQVARDLRAGDVPAHAPKDVFAQMAGTCAACHKDFRIRK